MVRFGDGKLCNTLLYPMDNFVRYEFTLQYIVLAYLMLFAALTNSVCLNNASSFLFFLFFIIFVFLSGL